MSTLPRSILTLGLALIVVAVLVSLPFPFYSRRWLSDDRRDSVRGNIVVTAAWMIRLCERVSGQWCISVLAW